MANGIEGHNDRDLGAIRQVGCQHAPIETLFRVARRQHHVWIVAVPPTRQHIDITLFRFGRHSGRWAGALAINDDQRYFGRTTVTNTFLHESNAGPGRCRHRPDPGQRCTDGQVHRGQFIFCLHDHAAGLGQVADQEIHHIGRRCDRIACKESSTGCHETHGRCVIARNKHPFLLIFHRRHGQDRVFTTDPGTVGKGMPFVECPDVRLELGAGQFPEVVSEATFHFFVMQPDDAPHQAKTQAVLEQVAAQIPDSKTAEWNRNGQCSRRHQAGW